MWSVLGFLFTVFVFFSGYAIGWTHGREDLLDEQARSRGELAELEPFEEDDDD